MGKTGSKEFSDSSPLGTIFQAEERVRSCPAQQHLAALASLTNGPFFVRDKSVCQGSLGELISPLSSQCNRTSNESLRGGGNKKSSLCI